MLIHEYITGGGLAGQELPESLAREGHAMRRALAEDFGAVEGVSVLMTLDARFPDEPGPWRALRVGAGEEAACLREHGRAADELIVIAPETDELLLERHDWSRTGRPRWLGSGAAAIATAGNKLATAAVLRSRSVRTVPVRRCGPLDAPMSALAGPDHWLSGPVVVKPIAGAGGVGTFLVADAAELAEVLRPAGEGPDRSDGARGLLARLGAMLVQPYVPGIPMSASFLVDREGTAHLVGVGAQDVTVCDGRFQYRGGRLPSGTIAMAEEARRAIAAVPGLAGWVGVDWIWDERERAVILEINPRLTTSYVGLRRLFPPGELARAWLLAFEDPAALGRLELARRAHAQSPIAFAADGTVRG